MIGLPRGAGFGRGPGGGVGDGTAREELSVNTFVIIKKLSLSPMYMSCVINLNLCTSIHIQLSYSDCHQRKLSEQTLTFVIYYLEAFKQNAVSTNLVESISV